MSKEEMEVPQEILPVTQSHNLQLEEILKRVLNSTGDHINVEDIKEYMAFFDIKIDIFLQFFSMLDFSNREDFKLYCELRYLILNYALTYSKPIIHAIIARKFLEVITPVDMQSNNDTHVSMAQFINSNKNFEDLEILSTANSWSTIEELKWTSHLYKLNNLYNLSSQSIQDEAYKEALKIFNCLKFIKLSGNITLLKYTEQNVDPSELSIPDIDQYIKAIETSIGIKELKLLNVWKELLHLQLFIDKNTVLNWPIRKLVDIVKKECDTFLYKILETPNLTLAEIKVLDNSYLSLKKIRQSKIDFAKTKGYINKISEDNNRIFNNMAIITCVFTLAIIASIICLNPIPAIFFAVINAAQLWNTVNCYNQSQKSDQNYLDAVTTLEKYNSIISALESTSNPVANDESANIPEIDVIFSDAGFGETKENSTPAPESQDIAMESSPGSLGWREVSNSPIVSTLSFWCSPGSDEERCKSTDKFPSRPLNSLYPNTIF